MGPAKCGTGPWQPVPWVARQGGSPELTGPRGAGRCAPEAVPAHALQCCPLPQAPQPRSTRLGLLRLRKQTGWEEEGGGAQPLPSQARRHQEVGVLALPQAPACRTLQGCGCCPTARPARLLAGLIRPLSCPQPGHPDSGRVVFISCCQ